MADTSVATSGLTRRDKAAIVACSLGLTLLVGGSIGLWCWVMLAR